MLAAETNPAGRSHQQPTAWLAECSTVDDSIMQKKNSYTRRPFHIFCVYFIHHQIRTSCISYFNSACISFLLVWPFSCLGSQNDLTFVGAISSTSPKSEHFVLIITRFFVVRGTVILLYPPIAHESHVTRQSIRTSYP